MGAELSPRYVDAGAAGAGQFRNRSCFLVDGGRYGVGDRGAIDGGGCSLHVSRDNAYKPQATRARAGSRFCGNTRLIGSLGKTSRRANRAESAGDRRIHLATAWI